MSRIVDSHHHLWQYNPSRHQWIDETMSEIKRDFSAEDLLEVTAANQVSATVVVQVDQSEKETLWLLDQAEKCQVIQGVVGWIDLRSDQLEERLESFSNFPKLKGFRHIAQSEPADFLIYPEFLSGIGCLERYDLTYDILIYHHQLSAAIQLVDSFPNQLFVLDHLGKPVISRQLLQPWANQIKTLAGFPNTFCKLSGLITEADHHQWDYRQLVPYLEVVLEAFGAERLMFGSDWPVCLLAGSYDQVLTIIKNFIEHLSDREKRLILGENATQFYQLQVK